MGRLFSEKGDIKKAQEWLDYALAARADEPPGPQRRAGWLLDQGRAQDARTEADEAVKLDPKSSEARRLRAFIAWHLRDLAGAEISPRVAAPRHTR